MTGRVDAAGIEAERIGEVRHERTGEGDIVDAALRVDAGDVPALRVAGAFGRHEDEAVGIGDGDEAAVGLLLGGGLAVAVEVEDERGGATAAVAGRQYSRYTRSPASVSRDSMKLPVAWGVAVQPALRMAGTTGPRRRGPGVVSRRARVGSGWMPVVECAFSSPPPPPPEHAAAPTATTTTITAASQCHRIARL